MDFAPESWRSLPELKLRAGVQVLVAADSRPLLKAPNGRFVVTSSTSSGLLELLQEGLSGAELAEATGLSMYSGTPGNAGAALASFLGVLNEAGMLTISRAAGRPKAGLFAGIAVDFMKRMPLRFQADNAFDPFGRHLRKIPPRMLAVALLVAFVLSVASAVYLIRGRIVGVEPSTLLVAAALVLVMLPLHESCHAIAMRYWGIHIREVGVGLMAFVAPVAYVDRTETYALQSRWGRFTIAIVGPVCDAACALAFAVASFAIPELSAEFAVAASMQLAVMVMNLNPLLRGDGYHAVEAACGRMNVRAHAFEFVVRVLLRRPQPAHLGRLRSSVRVGYFAYVILGLLYMLGTIGALLTVVGSMVGAML